MDRLKRHWALFDALCAKLEIFILWLSEQKVRRECCVEWPRHCSDWLRLKVQNICRLWQLGSVTFDGCAFGVKTRAGLLLKKPWRLCSNDAFVLKHFQKSQCTRDHPHGECRGEDCKLSDNYSHRMVRLVHKTFRQSADMFLSYTMSRFLIDCMRSIFTARRL